MPDETGKLSPAETAKIAETINSRWADRNQACPICGSTHWVVGDFLVMPMTMGPNREVRFGAGPIYPFVACFSPCGYTRFFNAVMLGVVPSSSDIEKSATEQKKEPDGR